MPLVQVKESAAITLPTKIRKALDIEEGDYLQVDIEGSKVVLTPQLLANRVPAVTLSPKGEQMLEERLADVKASKIQEVKNVDELINDLHK